MKRSNKERNLEIYIERLSHERTPPPGERICLLCSDFAARKDMKVKAFRMGRESDNFL